MMAFILIPARVVATLTDEQTRSVRIPLNQNSNLAKLARTDTQLTQSLGRSPTDQEIALEMDEPVETIRALRRVAASELSLDAPIDRADRDSASFGERFATAFDARWPVTLPPAALNA